MEPPEDLAALRASILSSNHSMPYGTNVIAIAAIPSTNATVKSIEMEKLEC